MHRKTAVKKLWTTKNRRAGQCEFDFTFGNYSPKNSRRKLAVDNLPDEVCKNFASAPRKVIFAASRRFQKQFKVAKRKLSGWALPCFCSR
jgi:hypothetical protein